MTVRPQERVILEEAAQEPPSSGSTRETRPVSQTFSRTRRLVLAVAVLLFAAGVIFGPSIAAAAQRSFDGPGQPVDIQVTVTDPDGKPLVNRLAALFLNGTSVAMTNDTGSLRGSVPGSVGELPGTVTLREGEAKRLTYPPTPAVVAYAFHGDRLDLDFLTITCQLRLTDLGEIVCPTHLPDTSFFNAMRFAMLAFLAVPIFIAVFRSVRHLVGGAWSNAVPGKMALPLVAVAMGSVATFIIVGAFWYQGLADQWILMLSTGFVGVAVGFIGAVLAGVGFIAMGMQLRSTVPPR